MLCRFSLIDCLQYLILLITSIVYTELARRNDYILNDCHSVNFGHNEMK